MKIANRKRAHINTPVSAPVVAEKKKTDKSKKRFFTGYLIFVAVFFLLGAVFLCFLWSSLDRYEKSENEKAEEEARVAEESERLRKELEEYKKLVDADAAIYNPETQTKSLLENGYEELVSTAEFERSIYETDSGISDMLTLKYPCEGLAISSESKGGTIEVSVSAGETLLFTLTYKTDEKSEYGNDIWKLQSAKYFRDSDISLSISVPSGSEVKVSERILDETDELTYAPISELQPYKSYADIPECSVYTLNGLSYIPNISVTLDGEILGGTIDSDNNMVFDYPESKKELSDELKDSIYKCSEAYNLFVAGDAEFDTIKETFIEGTDTYKSLSMLDNNWYMIHDGIKLSDYKINSCIYYTESIIKCRVCYTEVLNRWGGVLKSTPVDETMILIKRGNKWYAAYLLFN